MQLDLHQFVIGDVSTMRTIIRGPLILNGFIFTDHSSSPPFGCNGSDLLPISDWI